MTLLLNNENSSYKDLLIVKSIINKNVDQAELFVNNNSACDLYYMKQGDGEIVYDNEIYPVSEKSLIMLCAKKSIAFRPKNSCCFVMVSILENEMFNSFPPESIFPVVSLKESMIETILDELYNEIRHKRPLYENIANTRIKQLILLILRELNIEDLGLLQSDNKTIISEVKKYIEEKFNENLTIDSIAEKFHISNSLLAHSFKDAYGVSPINYLINVRITTAKKLLSNTDYSVQQISEKVGYNNSNYFSLLFKKLTGKTPTDFRLNTRRKI